MSARELEFSLAQLKDHAETLFEVTREYGEGEANPFRLSDWDSRYGRGRKEGTVRRHWERARLAWDVMGFDVGERSEGKLRELIFSPGTQARADQVFTSLTRDLNRDDFVATAFRTIVLDEIEVEGPAETDSTLVEQMKASIEACSLGVIHPIVVVGVVPPYRLGLGRVRFEASRDLGRATILARVVRTWDELAGIDENLVRGYSHTEQARLKIQREALIAQRRAEGFSNGRIAAELGMAEATVRRSTSSNDEVERLTAVGLDGKSHPCSRTTPEELRRRRERVRELKRENPQITTSQVAQALGVSQGTAHNTIKAVEATEEVVPFEIEYELPPPVGLRSSPVVVEEAGWDETDPEQDPGWACLSAIEEGLGQLLGDLVGTDQELAVRSLLRIWRGVATQLRQGSFVYELPTWGSPGAQAS